MKKIRFRTVLLSIMLLFICSTCFTAFATETEQPSDTEPSVSEPAPTIEPSEPPPESTPTPTPAATPEPSSESSEEYEPTPEPTPEPEPDPTETPYYEPDPTRAPDPVQAVATPKPTTRPKATTAPSTDAITRPKATLNPGTTTDTAAGGSNYMVFARLSTRENSLASTMMLGGAICIGLGIVGLGILLFFFIRNRKRRRDDDTDGIFEEIEQAENRMNPAYMNPQEYDGEYDDYEDYDGEYNPEEDYESSYDSQDDGYQDYYDNAEQPDDPYAPYAQEAGYEPSREPGINSGHAGYVHPQEASLYTEELDAQQIREAAAPSAPPAVPAQPSQNGDKQYDTMEILLEALGNQEDDQP